MRAEAIVDTGGLPAGAKSAGASPASIARLKPPRARESDEPMRPVELDRDVPPPRMARRILLVILASYLFIGFLDIPVDNPGRASQAGALLCMLAAGGLQVLHVSQGARLWSVRRRALSLSAQTVLTYLPYFVFHFQWGGMAGFLAGSFLLLVPRPRAWLLFGTAVSTMLVFGVVHHVGVMWTSYYVVSTMLLGLIMFGMTRLVGLVDEVHRARSELARMAVTQERLRFARDLHDLLGYSLSSITLKTELAYRLVDTNPARARDELASVLEVSRQALADVRVVASSYRSGLRLSDEAEMVRSMLVAADVDVRVEIACGNLSHQLDMVLATVLREGVTNVLRHSKAQTCLINCRVTDGAAVLELVNDGVPEQRDEPTEYSGSGLDNLAVRLAAVGGTLTAEAEPEGWFRLIAHAPLDRGAAA